jgi:hypothetical protein
MAERQRTDCLSPTTAAGSRPAELRDLALDLRLDIERGLAVPGSSVVAGDDEVTDLGSQLRIDVRGGQALELLLNVDRRLAAPLSASVPRLQQLADLGVSLEQGGG